MKDFPEIYHEDDGNGNNYRVMLDGKLVIDLNDLQPTISIDDFDAIFGAGLKAGYQIAKMRKKRSEGLRDRCGKFIEEFDAKRPDRILQTLSTPEGVESVETVPPKVKCKTCDDRGYIGGWCGPMNGDGGYEDEDCPDCHEPPNTPWTGVNAFCDGCGQYVTDDGGCGCGS